MGPVLIIIGIALVVTAILANRPQGDKAMVIHQNETTYPARPKAPTHKMIAYGAGVAMFVIALAVLFSGGLSRNWPVFVLLSAGLIILSAKIFQFGSKADQREAENMRSRLQATQHHAQHERTLIELENARREAERKAQLQYFQDLAEKEKLEAARLAAVKQQRDILHEETLRSAAQKLGVKTSDVIALNVERVRAQLELEKNHGQNNLDNQKRWEQIQQNINAANLVALASSEQMKQLTTSLVEAVNQLVMLEGNSWPEEQKATIREQLKKNITYFQEAIDGLHTGARRVQGDNGKKGRGIGSGGAKPGANYPPGVGDDEV